MKTTFLYTLTDPNTGQIRYVGKSDNPFKRLYFHLKDTGDYHRTRWIQSLQHNGQVPVLDLLDEVPMDQWQFWEREYIRVFRMIGIPLVNSTIGGDGVMSGRSPSLEARKKQSLAMTGRKRSAESVARSARSRTGVKRSFEYVERNRRISFGKKRCNNTSGFVGVTWDKQTNQWRAGYMWFGKTFNLGRFDNIQDAVAARETAVAERKVGY